MDDHDQDDDFATLFAKSEKTRRFETGQAIGGTIVAIGDEVAFVGIGGKGEATIALDELRDDDGALQFGVGDRIEATIVSTKGGVTLSRKLQRRAATTAQIESAFHSGLPVEGKVDEQVKGGFSVSIAKSRAFCPLSQIDVVRDADPASHLGRVYTFKIIEFGEGGRKFVVSRRALLEQEQKVRADEVRKSIAAGAVLSGKVVSVRDFGAFVDLGGGVQGLLHVSEMGWTRVDNPAQIVAPGQDVTVKVLRIDEATQQIALSMKALMADPWEAASLKYQIGQTYRGQVARVAEFGLFVELEPGITGLVPASETGVAKGTDLKKAFPVGTALDVIVLEVDGAARKMRLSIRAIAAAAEAAEVRDYGQRAQSSESTSFGGLADKLRDALKSRDR